MNLAIAMMGGKGQALQSNVSPPCPLEKRYVWRVASALKWAFADFDTVTVEADRQTLSPEDRKRWSTC